MEYQNIVLKTIISAITLIVISQSFNVMGLISEEQRIGFIIKELESKGSRTAEEQETLQELYKKMIPILESHISSKEWFLKRARPGLTPEALTNQQEQLRVMREERDRMVKKLE